MFVRQYAIAASSSPPKRATCLFQISVLTKPGATQLMRISCLANSQANPLVSRLTAPLAAAYGEEPEQVAIVWTEVMLTIAPPALLNELGNRELA